MPSGPRARPPALCHLLWAFTMQQAGRVAGVNNAEAGSTQGSPRGGHHSRCWLLHASFHSHHSSAKRMALPPLCPWKNWEVRVTTPIRSRAESWMLAGLISKFRFHPWRPLSPLFVGPLGLGWMTAVIGEPSANHRRAWTRSAQGHFSLDFPSA